MHSRYRTDGGDIDFFLIAGPAVRQVVAASYTDHDRQVRPSSTNCPGLSWFLHVLPGTGKDCDDAIIEFIDTTKRRGHSGRRFQLSSGYCTVETDKGVKRCVFTWNKKRFKDPKEFFQQMKVRGVTVTPNVKPGIFDSPHAGRNEEEKHVCQVQHQ